MRSTCTVCTAPPEIQAAVIRALARGATLREISASSGLSKSAIHRHGKKCLDRATLKKFRNQKIVAAQNARLATIWPTGEMWRQAHHSDAHGTLTGQKLVLADLNQIDIEAWITIEEDLPLKNPRSEQVRAENSEAANVTS
jgi:hypothetical protein